MSDKRILPHEVLEALIVSGLKPNTQCEMRGYDEGAVVVSACGIGARYVAAHGIERLEDDSPIWDWAEREYGSEYVHAYTDAFDCSVDEVGRTLTCGFGRSPDVLRQRLGRIDGYRAGKLCRESPPKESAPQQEVGNERTPGSNLAAIRCH